jgi:hypothetical protein
LAFKFKSTMTVTKSRLSEATRDHHDDASASQAQPSPSDFFITIK